VPVTKPAATLRRAPSAPVPASSDARSASVKQGACATSTLAPGGRPTRPRRNARRAPARPRLRGRSASRVVITSGSCRPEATPERDGAACAHDAPSDGNQRPSEARDSARIRRSSLVRVACVTVNVVAASPKLAYSFGGQLLIPLIPTRFHGTGRRARARASVVRTGGEQEQPRRNRTRRGRDPPSHRGAAARSTSRRRTPRSKQADVRSRPGASAASARRVCLMTADTGRVRTRAGRASPPSSAGRDRLLRRGRGRVQVARDTTTLAASRRMSRSQAPSELRRSH
jgi:hypothetical protein